MENKQTKKKDKNPTLREFPLWSRLNVINHHDHYFTIKCLLRKGPSTQSIVNKCPSASRNTSVGRVEDSKGHTSLAFYDYLVITLSKQSSLYGPTLSSLRQWEGESSEPARHASTD